MRLGGATLGDSDHNSAVIANACEESCSSAKALYASGGTTLSHSGHNPDVIPNVCEESRCVIELLSVLQNFCCVIPEAVIWDPVFDGLVKSQNTRSPASSNEQVAKLSTSFRGFLREQFFPEVSNPFPFSSVSALIPQGYTFSHL
jgi:hypothetical protein